MSADADETSPGLAWRLTLGIGALPGLLLYGLWTVTGGRMLQQYLFALPNSRKMEAEADHIGLMMMSEACYDPREAVNYWQKMARLAGNREGETPASLMTHPTVRTRST